VSDMATIGEQVEQMHVSMAGGPPDPVMAVFGEEQALLATGGLPAGVAELGETVPDLELLDAHGAAHGVPTATLLWPLIRRSFFPSSPIEA
jgi:hypothetical protein